MMSGVGIYRKKVHIVRGRKRFALGLVLGGIFLLFQGGGFLFSQEGASLRGVLLNGYGRSKVGVLLKNGDYFLAENTLDMRFRYETDDLSFYSNVVLYERDGEGQTPDMREMYLEWRSTSFDLRMGKQQVIWGKADGVFITDVVSPRDLSQFLIPDFEEIRRAVTGVRLDIYSLNRTFEFIWVPWFTPTVLPSRDSLWAPQLPFPVTSTIRIPEEPELSLQNSSYYARYSQTGTSFDVSFIGGWFWNDTPSYQVISPSEIQPEYYRVYTVGYAIAGTLGPVVLKSEGSYTGQKRYQGKKKDTIQYLVGGEYSFFGFTLGLQYLQSIILDYEDTLPEDAYQHTVTVSLSRTLFRDTVKLEVFSYIGINDSDALVKPKLTWNPSDALELFCGAYLFLGNDGEFGQYHDRNGVYMGAKVSF